MHLLRFVQVSFAYSFQWRLHCRLRAYYLLLLLTKEQSFPKEAEGALSSRSWPGSILDWLALDLHAQVTKLRCRLRASQLLTSKGVVGSVGSEGSVGSVGRVEGGEARIRSSRAGEEAAATTLGEWATSGQWARQRDSLKWRRLGRSLKLRETTSLAQVKETGSLTQIGSDSGPGKLGIKSLVGVATCTVPPWRGRGRLELKYFP